MWRQGKPTRRQCAEIPWFTQLSWTRRQDKGRSASKSVSMRRVNPCRLIVALAALVGLVAGAVPASAECTTSVFTCNTNHDQYGAQEMNIRQIATTAYLRSDNQGLSRDLYQSLIPAPYSMPSQLLVGLSLAQIDVPKETTGQLAPQQSYLDGTIAILVGNGGIDSWYPISQLTSSQDVYASGRAAGFPRYLATGSFGAAGQGWQGEASVGGQRSMFMDFVENRYLFMSEELKDWSFQRAPYVALSNIFSGSRNRVQHYHKAPVPAADALGASTSDDVYSAFIVPNVTRLAPIKRGIVRFTVDPDLNRLDAGSPTQLPDVPFGEGRSLSDLIGVDQASVGTYWQTDSLRITQTDNLDDDKDGTVPQLPPLPTQGVIVAAAAQFATMTVVVTRGGSVTFVNADIGGIAHGVVSYEYGADGKPLFESAVIEPGQSAPVTGVETLPRDQYKFICSLHGPMALNPGQLIVQ